MSYSRTQVRIPGKVDAWTQDWGGMIEFLQEEDVELEEAILTNKQSVSPCPLEQSSERIHRAAGQNIFVASEPHHRKGG